MAAVEDLGVISEFLNQPCFQQMLRIKQCVPDTIMLEILPNPGDTCIIRCPSPYPQINPTWKITIGNRTVSCFHKDIPERATTLRQCFIY
ncbi:unnamed protein product, partial [Hymenolepis diminuta]